MNASGLYTEILAELSVVYASRMRSSNSMRQESMMGENLLTSIEMQDETSKAVVGGNEVDLSEDEYLILKLIKQAEGAIVHMHQIRSYIDNQRKNDAASLNLTVNGLKRKLGKAGRGIESILGIGYRLRVEL
jgi:DNA-binding response OmpR family regulator